MIHGRLSARNARRGARVLDPVRTWRNASGIRSETPPAPDVAVALPLRRLKFGALRAELQRSICALCSLPE